MATKIAGSISISTTSAERAIGYMIQTLDKMGQRIQVAAVQGSEGMSSLEKTMRSATKSVVSIDREAERLATKIGASDESIREYQAAFQAVADAEAEVTRQTDECRRAVERLNEAQTLQKTAAQEVNKIESELAKARGKNKPTTEIEDRLQAAQVKLSAAQQSVADETKKHEKIQSDAAKTAADYSGKILEQADALSKLRDTVAGSDDTDFDSNNITRMFNFLKSTASKDFLTIFKFAGFNGLSVIMREFSRECERNGRTIGMLDKIYIGFRATIQNARKAVLVFSKSLAAEFVAVYLVGKAMAYAWEKIERWWNAAEEKAKAVAEANQKMIDSFKEAAAQADQRISALETPGEKAKKDIEERNRVLLKQLSLLKQRQDLELQYYNLLTQKQDLMKTRERDSALRLENQKLLEEMTRIERTLAVRMGKTYRYPDYFSGIDSSTLSRRRDELSQKYHENQIRIFEKDGLYPRSLNPSLNVLDTQINTAAIQLSNLPRSAYLSYVARDQAKAFGSIVPSESLRIEENYQTSLKRWEEEVNATADTLKTLTDAGIETKEYSQIVDTAKESSRKAIEQQYLLSGVTGELIKSLNQANQPFEDYQKSLEELRRKHETLGDAFSNYEAAVEAVGKRLREQTLKEIDDGLNKSKSPVAQAVERLDAIDQWSEATGDAGNESSQMRNWVLEQFATTGPLGEITKAMEHQKTVAEKAAEAVSQIEEGYRVGLYGQERQAKLLEQVTAWMTQEQASEKNRSTTEIGAYLQGTVEAYQAEMRARTHGENRVENAVERGNRIAESSKNIFGTIESLVRTISNQKEAVVG